MEQNLFEIIPDMLALVANSYQRNRDSLTEDVKTLKLWIKTQPHLPDILSDKNIENILILCKCSIEKAKQRIDMYYTLRDKIPELYENINPKSSNVKEVMEISYWLPLPKLSKEMYRVFLFKMRDKTMIQKLEPNHLFKIPINILELRLHEDVMFGDIFISDMDGITFNYLTKLTPSFLKKVFTVYEKIFSLPLKGIWFINSPHYIENLVTLLKQLLKPKIAERIQVSQDDNLLKRFPKDMIPKDYGGTERSMEELHEILKIKFKQFEDRFDLLDTIKVNENLRPEKLENDEILGFYGNFKKLNVD